MTIARQLDSNGHLAASFFFDKRGGEEGTGTTKGFVTTIARQLARHIPSYHIELGKVLEKDRSIPKRPLPRQLALLVIEPLNRVQFPKNGPPLAIVLDALDECGDRTALEELISLVADLDTLPRHFKIFFTCRHHDAVVRRLERMDRTFIRDLDTEPSESVSSDLHRYVDSQIGQLSGDGEDQPWPPERPLVTKLVRRCGDLFEIAALRMRRIKDGPAIGNSYRDIFDAILEETDGHEPELDTEYICILRATYPHSEHRPRDLSNALANFRAVVGALVTIVHPLSLKSLAALLGMKKRRSRRFFAPSAP
jgi:hypothetical protein